MVSIRVGRRKCTSLLARPAGRHHGRLDYEISNDDIDRWAGQFPGVLFVFILAFGERVNDWGYSRS